MISERFLIRRAERADLTRVARLFDAYRQFYKKPGDCALAERFIGERLAAGDSVIFLAVSGGAAVGFAQVYPTFSSLRCGVVWILNDLFVDETARRSGLAKALLHAVADAARGAGVLGITLSTAHSNASAQALYTKLGYQVDRDFRTYSLDL